MLYSVLKVVEMMHDCLLYVSLISIHVSRVRFRVRVATSTMLRNLQQKFALDV